jgi:two-component system, OmpR family, sensor kinase
MLRRLSDPRAWPIRLRLTALNVGVLAATLALLGGALLFQLDDALVSITADHLRDQGRLALQTFFIVRPPGPGDFRRSPPGGFNLPRAAVAIERRLSGRDTGVMVFDTHGVLVTSSETADDLEDWPQPDGDQLSAALAGREISQVVGQQTRRTLLMVLPLHTSDGIVGALALATSLELADQLETRLRALLVVGTLIALMVAGGLGLRATRDALRPLDHVIGAAREIGAGNLSQRLRLTRRDEIGELAAAFDGMLDRLAGQLDAQRRFVADAAHELRTPLTALGGMVEMLQLGADRGDPATVQRMLNTMNREIERLGRLVADLLTLSRLDSDQPLALTEVALAPLVTEVADHTRLLSRGQQVDCLIEATPTVEANADRLRQVLLNLADNALKFTPPDGRIELRLLETDRFARLVVTDTGSGIPSEVLPRVMDRFVRGDASRARSTGGAGLGLAIARSIVEAHGGVLTIDSEPGRGTTATIDLPLPVPPLRSANVQLTGVRASDPTDKLAVTAGPDRSAPPT